ncbi:sensor histidine kinase [Aerosakkonema funiforme]|uniref:sensor histidine kinase n=1 Tax=Aerosakkonema funiforme TaxID=1246630 RepID=UPI0035B8CE2A
MTQEEISAIKSQFFATVAHDLRTPLTAILLSTELLETYGHETPEEKKRQYLRCIREAAEQINKLLNDALDSYGIE